MGYEGLGTERFSSSSCSKPLTDTIVQLATEFSGRSTYYSPNPSEIQISDEFDLDGRQIVFINTPDIRTREPTKALKLIAAFLANS